jgi:hypothetical protein
MGEDVHNSQAEPFCHATSDPQGGPRLSSPEQQNNIPPKQWVLSIAPRYAKRSCPGFYLAMPIFLPLP